MLQRIQTVYMLASVIAILMLFLFPLALFKTPEAIFELNAFGLVSVTPEVPFDKMQWALLSLLFIMLILPLVTIFMYKKQKQQLRMLIYASVLDVFFFVFFYLFELDVCVDMILPLLKTKQLEECGEFITVLMPIVSLFCNIIAMRGVCYDIALLASTDRLRPSRR